MNVLKLNQLTMQFGGVVAIDGLDLEVHEGEIVALIGPNGAGKTTVFNVITGVYFPTEGTVYFNDQNITRMRVDRITQQGIARTFQNIRLFKEMSVLENILIPQHMHLQHNFFSTVLRSKKARQEESQMQEKALSLLETVGLLNVKDEKASSLPYGQQRHLEIARALATKPKLLLLDEPAAGMNPQETLELTAFIKRIRDEFNLTVFMIEHHMELVMEISEHIYVLDFGKLIAKGTAEEIQQNERVIEAYLGVSEDAENQ
ncbi:MAG: ABC transporter ATP-binding protein [Niameybacter sp.]|uniref:ABC transporter ATP-binding protein n=1 Tax=Niameybacter sp. TaxID=2033640 RepID=UPI002FCADF94